MASAPKRTSGKVDIPSPRARAPAPSAPPAAAPAPAAVVRRASSFTRVADASAGDDAASGGGASSASTTRSEAMAAAAAAIARVKGSTQHKLSLHPHLVRAELEAVRFKHNEVLQTKIAFQERVEERRARLEAQAGSRAELRRMLSVHAASREDTRRDVLRGAVTAELDLIKQMKAMGVKSFAGLADAFG